MRVIKQTLLILLLTLLSQPLMAANWGYAGQHTQYPPSKWGNLKGASLCSSGKMQSPIHISSSDVAASGFKLRKLYDGDYVEVSNNGHAIVTMAGRYIEIDQPESKEGEIKTHRYTLQQFHFHTLSEHTVSLSPLDTPKHYDMEMHLVHVDGSGNIAVLGVFIEEGEYNTTLGELFENLPHYDRTHQSYRRDHLTSKKQREKIISQLTNNYHDLLPSESDLYVYQGSLTTPPCSEGVRWMILVEPIRMSRHQIQSYRALFTDDGMPYHTNRPVQKLNNRQVEYGISE